MIYLINGHIILYSTQSIEIIEMQQQIGDKLNIKLSILSTKYVGRNKRYCPRYVR